MTDQQREATVTDPKDSEREFVKSTIIELFAEHCAICHEEENPPADLSLRHPERLIPFKEHQETWTRILLQIRGRLMPPVGESTLGDQSRLRSRSLI